MSRCISAVLECATCSLHAMVVGVLCETVATITLSTLHFLDCSCCPGSPVVCEWGGGCCGGGRTVSPTGLTHRWCWMTRHLDDYCCSAEVSGSFQETAPRKTAENTVKHRDGGVGSVIANHCGGSESLVVVTTLHATNNGAFKFCVHATQNIACLECSSWISHNAACTKLWR